MTTKLNIAVVGAGLAGLTVALGLLRGGHRVRIYEQASKVIEIGAGISIAPNAAKVLISLGLGKALKACFDTPISGTILNGKTAEVLKVTSFGDTVEANFGEKYYQGHRADLHALLMQAVSAEDKDCLCLGHRLLDYEDNGTSVRLHFAGQPDQSSDIIIGADGINSVLRPSIVGPDNARFTRYITWRSLIPMESLPEKFAEPASKVFIGPERNFTFYPVRGGKLMNCVIFAGDSDWTEEGWNIKADINEIREAYSDYHSDLHTLIDTIPTNKCFKWALFDREPIDQWWSGNALLIGDAAHPMLPFLGQGASMAFEDAAELIYALNTQPSIETAFRMYQDKRLMRANWVLRESRAAGTRFADPAPQKSNFSNDQAMRSKELFTWSPPPL